MDEAGRGGSNEGSREGKEVSEGEEKKRRERRWRWEFGMLRNNK